MELEYIVHLAWYFCRFMASKHFRHAQEGEKMDLAPFICVKMAPCVFGMLVCKRCANRDKHLTGMQTVTKPFAYRGSAKSPIP